MGEWMIRMEGWMDRWDGTGWDRMGAGRGLGIE